MNIPRHFVDQKNKQVVFHIKGGYSISTEVPTWMGAFLYGYKGVTIRSKETFYKMREK